MRPLSVFVVRPKLGDGGADRITLTLLQHLDKQRFKATLVLNRRRGALLGEVPRDIEVVPLGAAGMLSAVRPLRFLLDGHKPDIVFSTSSGSNVTVALAARRPGPRLVLSERNGLVRDQPRHKLWPLLLAKRLLYPRADCVTAVSAGVAEDLRRRLRLPSELLRVVYNPVVTPDLASLTEEPVDESWFDEDIPVLLAAGRLVNAKGFDLLLEALARVRRQAACRVMVVGEGALRGQLLARAEALGIAKAVKLPGFVANPYAFMGRCAVFVLPSRFEGLPGVLIQAMACGASVVAADCAFGPAEIVTSGKDGILVPPEDPATLAEVLLALLRDSARRRALGEAARMTARRFSLEAVIPNYVRALDPEGV